MIDRKSVERIHALLIEEFGGTSGIRDLGALDSAIHRPYQTFDQKELYPVPVEKAAALFESLISNHPFIDGNKRTAYVLMRLILREHGLDIEATEDDKFNFVVAAAKAEINFDQIKTWIAAKLK